MEVPAMKKTKDIMAKLKKKERNIFKLIFKIHLKNCQTKIKEKQHLPYAVVAVVQLPPHFVVVLLNHQIGICVVSRVEVGDHTARNAENPHDCER